MWLKSLKEFKPRRQFQTKGAFFFCFLFFFKCCQCIRSCFESEARLLQLRHPRSETASARWDICGPALEPAFSLPRSSDIDFWFAPPDLLSRLISLLPTDCWNVKKLNAAWKNTASAAI